MRKIVIKEIDDYISNYRNEVIIYFWKGIGGYVWNDVESDFVVKDFESIRDVIFDYFINNKLKILIGWFKVCY